MRRFLFPALICGILPIGGCGPSLTGEYKCTGGLLDMVKLQSGGRVYVTASLLGARMEKAGTYEVDGDRVILKVEGKSDVFTKAGKTLDGGVIQGKCFAQ